MGGHVTLTSERTVGDIASESPAAARIFEKYRIDYCCGGDKSLATACEGKGVSPDEVLAELEHATRSAEDRDWTTAPLAELADYIIAKHHVFLRNELPALGNRIAKVIDAHGAHHSDSLIPLRQTYQALRSELEAHMLKEENILFPMIKSMEQAEMVGAGFSGGHCGSVNNPIRVMQHEHDNAGEALREMRRITCDYTLPADACVTYGALFQGLEALEADLHAHIHLENNILFPRASGLEQRLQS
jgi:regulator of cell morphogenesis and NO signaling